MTSSAASVRPVAVAPEAIASSVKVRAAGPICTSAQRSSFFDDVGSQVEMSCYVDTVRAYPEAGLRYTDFCHLLADSRDELHTMAGALGVPRQLFQDHSWRWHYDLPGHLRAEAVSLGAIEVTMHFVGSLLRDRRGTLGSSGSEPPGASASIARLPEEQLDR